MQSATAVTTTALARRRALNAMFASLGFDTAAPSMRRAGKASIDTRLDDPASIASVSQTLSGPPNAVAWLNRATFGCTQADLTAFNALGASDTARWTAWVTQQTSPTAISDTAGESRITSANFKALNLTPAQLWSTYHSDTVNYNHRMLPIAESECATLIRQIYSKRQLHESMIDFWHDHFSINGWDYDGGPMFPAFDALFRATSASNGVFGNFKNLLINVAESASMMYMLDLYSSTRAGPNENYARELCELHTLGAMNYAGVLNPFDPSLPIGSAGDGAAIRLKYVDADVYNITRALTGWTMSQSTYDTRNDLNPGTFEYVDGLHDQYDKFFLNRYLYDYEHQQDGFDVFAALACHPGVATFIATKLCRRLVSDSPSPTLVSNIASVFLQNWQAPNQLQIVTQAILNSTDFANSWGQKMKRPGVAMVSTLRVLGANFTPLPDLDNPNFQANTWSTTNAVLSALQSAGHRLFYWPAPNGYPDVQVAWASSGSLGMTLRMLAMLLEMTQDQTVSTSPYLADVQAQTLAAFPATATRTAANVAGFWCTQILGYQPTGVYNAAVDFLRQNVAATAALTLTTDTWSGGNLSNHYTMSRLRSMIALILCSPDFLTR